MEIGVNYPNYPDVLPDDMQQIYFSKKVIEHDMPGRFLDEKDTKSCFLIPCIKGCEGHILKLAEENPAIKSKFHDFPFLGNILKFVR